MSNNSFIDEMLISVNSWCVSRGVRRNIWEMENVSLFLINVRMWKTSTFVWIISFQLLTSLISSQKMKIAFELKINKNESQIRMSVNQSQSEWLIVHFWLNSSFNSAFIPTPTSPLQLLQVRLFDMTQMRSWVKAKNDGSRANSPV